MEKKDIKDAPNLSFSSFISFKNSSFYLPSLFSLSSTFLFSILLSSCGPLHFFFAPLDLIADPS